ncbi:hypothetical protein BMS3Abin14_00932 [bacterium BMS3Abin14]|nr:hypothetical protein BMS3Abin14_00932 [bacterium BMS3Abin14]
MEQEVRDVVPDHIVPVAGSQKAHLVVDGVGCHQERAVHGCLRVPAEGRRIPEENRDVGDFPDIDVFLDMMEIVVVPVGREGVGVEKEDGGGQESESHRNPAVAGHFIQF